MRIQLTVGGQTLTATLAESKAAADFVSLLPLTLTLEDYAGTEKVSDLPERLSTDGAPSGYQAAAGDITYYAPWGNLAIFYRDFRYAEGLIFLGRLEGDIEHLKASGSVNVTLERVNT